MNPIYVTETPGTFRLSFDYNPRLIEVIKRIPSRPRWDNGDRVWIVSKKSPFYPPGFDARWYVEAFAGWAVKNRYCLSVQRRK